MIRRDHSRFEIAPGLSAIGAGCLQYEPVCFRAWVTALCGRHPHEQPRFQREAGTRLKLFHLGDHERTPVAVAHVAARPPRATAISTHEDTDTRYGLLGCPRRFARDELEVA